jgi:hypothetical protein
MKNDELTLGIRFISAAAHTHFAPKKSNSADNHRPIMKWGASMSVLETVIFALILVWAPGLMLGAYLTWGRPRHVD